MPLPFVDPEEWRKRQLANYAASNLPQIPEAKSPDIPLVYNNAPAMPSNRMLYEQELEKEPRISQYPPSRARNIFSILGGIGAGIASRSVPAGMSIAHQIKYAPFQKQEEQFQQELGIKKAAAESEDLARQRQAQQAELETRRGAEEARAKAEGAREAREQTQKEILLRTGGIKPGAKPNLVTLELNNGEIIYGAEEKHRPDTQERYYEGPNGEIIEIKAVKKEIAGTKQPVKKETFTSYGQAASNDWFERHPGQNMPPEVMDEIYRKDAELKKETKESPRGRWDKVEDSAGNITYYNPETEETKSAPEGVRPVGTKAKADAARAKITEPINEAISYADSYIKSGQFTGPEDVTLQLKFFQVAAAVKGFRMTQAEQNLIQHARSFASGLRARVSKVTGGTLYDDKQRRQIVDAIKAAGEAAKRASEVTEEPRFTNFQMGK